MLIFREAHDLSFLERYKPKGEGVHGIYYGAFPKNKIKEIRDKLGIIDPNIGVKVFRFGSYLVDNIKEILTIHFIFPELNKIGIKTTHTNQPLSISNLIHNRFIPLQHIEGETLKQNIPYEIYDSLSWQIRDELKSRMDTVGIKWGDAHPGNYIVAPVIINKIMNDWAEFRIQNKNIHPALRSTEFLNNYKINLVDYITIVDPGNFRCLSDSEAGRKIQDYREKLNPYLKSSSSGTKRSINLAFEELLI